MTGFHVRACLVLCCLLSTSYLYAKDVEVVAGVFKIEPFGFHDSEGQITGVTSEIIKAIELESGIPLKQKLLPYKRMISYLGEGKIDFSIFFKSKLSVSLSESVIPLYDLDTVVIGRSELVISNYDDMYRFKLATPIGVKYKPQLDDDKRLNIEYVRDYDNAILMLKNGHVDAIIAPEKILYYQLDKLGVNSELLGEPFVLIKNTAWLQFSQKSKQKAVIPKLKAAVERLHHRKEVESILRRYFQ